MFAHKRGNNRGISATFDGWGYLKSQHLSCQVWGKNWAQKILQNNSFFLSTLLASWPSYSRLFPACSMKSYCIIVIIYKEKPGLRIPFILDLGKVTCMLQGQENNESATAYIHHARPFLQSLCAGIPTMSWLPRNLKVSS